MRCLRSASDTQCKLSIINMTNIPFELVFDIKPCLKKRRQSQYYVNNTPVFLIEVGRIVILEDLRVLTFKVILNYFR